MNCLTPRLVFRDRYGHVYWSRPPVRIEFRSYLVGCGRCVACLMAEQRDWALRLQLEAEVSESAWFVTLTFSDENLPKDNSVHKEDLQRFMNTLRKKMERICKENNVVVPHLSYFAVGEYGRRGGRPHYHIMLFGMPCHSLIEMYNVASDVWKRGFVKVEPCSSQTCNYVAKYMTKIDPREHEVKPFRLMSLKSALGIRYFELHPDVVEYMNRPEVHCIVTKDGRKHRIPRSIRRKYFSFDKKMCALEECELTPASYEVYIRNKDWISGKERNRQWLERVFSKYH